MTLENVLIEISVLFVAIFPAFTLMNKVHCFKSMDLCTKVIASFVLSLAFLLLPLYFVGIIFGNGFKVTSWVLYTIIIMALCFSVKDHLSKFRGYIKKIKDINLTTLDLALIIFVMFFIAKYIFILSIKSILDPDALVYYLPFARSIFKADHIPLGMYNIEPLIKPVGISVLYAWIYSLSNSPFVENFRLVPLAFIVMTMLIIYSIAKDFGSKNLAKIAVMVYMLLPLHDEILMYFSHYNDISYNALILAVFYFLYRYVKSHEAKYTVLAGLSLGLSALMKAQAAYFFPTILFLFLSRLGRRSQRLIAVYLSSAIAGFLFVFLIWPDRNYFLNLSIGIQVIILLFAMALTTIVAVNTEAQAKTSYLPAASIYQILKGMLVFFGTALIFSSVWYLRNYFSTGSLIWTVYLQGSDPDLKWANNFLSSIQTQVPQNSILLFLSLLILISFIYPALGTAWILPKAVGVIKSIRIKKEGLLMINWICGYILGYFWNVVGGFEVFILNERDIYPIVPFLSIFSAIGIVCIAKHFTKKLRDTATVYILVFLGFFSLIQSRLMHDSIVMYSTVASHSSNAFSGVLISLWKVPVSSQNIVPTYPLFLYQSVQLIGFAFITSLLFLTPLFLIKKTNFSPLKRGIIKFRLYRPKIGKAKTQGTIILLILATTMQVAPYVWLTYEVGNGNIQAFGENQLRLFWGDLYAEILPYLSEKAKPNDVILTVGARGSGLQYSLGETRLIDITNEFNLAALRRISEFNDSAIIFHQLRQLNVRYFLLPREPNLFMNKFSEISLLLDVGIDSRYFTLVVQSKEWNLYKSVES